MSDTFNSGAMPTMRSEIEFFNRHGYLRYPIQGGEETTETTETKADPDTALGLGDAGKAALKQERDARAIAEKAAKDSANELTALRKEKAERESEKAKADEADAVQKGEFQTLAEKRKEEADAARADAESKGKTLERASAVLKSVVAARIKELEALEDKDLLAAFPKDADPLDQLEWLDDPRTKSAMRVASEEKKVTDANGKPRVPGTPKPNGNGNENDEHARAAQARGYREW